LAAGVALAVVPAEEKVLFQEESVRRLTLRAQWRRQDSSTTEQLRDALGIYLKEMAIESYVSSTTELTTALARMSLM
jgi:hypothetical protein